MKLYLPRVLSFDKRTVGHLFINYEHFCYTLEDVTRPKGVKVYGKTAIPEGLYKVVVTYSPKFKKLLPLILNVDNFVGIRMHKGVHEDHSEGCILLGYNLNSNCTLSSDTAADDLTKIILKEKSVTLEIVNYVK